EDVLERVLAIVERRRSRKVSGLCPVNHLLSARELLAPERLHHLVERCGRLVDLLLAGELHEQCARLLEDFRGYLRILKHELDLLELPAVAKGLLKRGVRRVRMRHLTDEHLDRARAYARGDTDPHRVSIPAVRRTAELVEVLAE